MKVNKNLRKKQKERRPKKRKKIFKLTPYERAANDVLRNADRKLSTNEVADFSGMSWSTAKKHLTSLEKKRKSIHIDKKGKTKFWFFKK